MDLISFIFDAAERIVRSYRAATPRVRYLLQSIAALSVLLMRRGQALTCPQVWAEEGKIIEEYLAGGFSSLFEPMNGYLILIPRLIAAFSLNVSIVQYPLIATAITWAFTIGVLLLVAHAPIMVRGGFFLSLLALAVPSDPEVFGTTLYTFWWSTLILFVIVLWEPEHLCFWKLPLLLIVGLSTPVIILAFPILLFRSIWFRGTEWMAAAVAGLCSAVQLAFTVKTNQANVGTPLNLSSIVQVIERFFGDYLIGNFAFSSSLAFSAGIILLVVLMIGSSFWYQELATLILLFLLFGSVAMSCVRTDVRILDQAIAGPRYFFFPYLLTSWLLLHRALAIDADSSAFSGSILKHRYLSSSLFVILAISVANMIPVLSRQHDDLEWSKHVLSAALYSEYSIPVQMDGNAERAWEINVEGEIIKRWLDRDIAAWSRYECAFPYRQVSASNIATGRFSPRIVSSNAVSAISSSQAEVPFVQKDEAVFIGGHPDLDMPANAEKILLNVGIWMKRGDAVLYRGGYSHDALYVRVSSTAGIDHSLPAVSGISILEFSSPELPDSFKVEFVDQGWGVKDWFVIGVINNSVGIN